MVFSHDGLRDSLTYLAAPPYFYENLRRELTYSQRNKSRLSLIRFQLSPQIPEDDSLYEAAILSFSELLKGEIRSEDLCARLGRFEFTMVLKVSNGVAISIAERILSQWHAGEFNCRAYVVSAHAGESSLEILNRLDTTTAL